MSALLISDIHFRSLLYSLRSFCFFGNLGDLVGRFFRPRQTPSPVLFRSFNMSQNNYLTTCYKNILDIVYLLLFLYYI
nr:MAG TPA: FMRP KH0 domain [Bacteriophage sp.]